MSRIVVKNLPRTITAEQLKAKFAEKGTVTDVQLKYTPDGKFRRFAFIGFHREDQATAAIDYFNNTYVFSAKIKVELCSNLGDTNKPKSWSKYAPDSSAYQKLHNQTPNDDSQGKEKHSEDLKAKKKSKSNTSDPLLTELVEKHKDDPKFSDFLQLHGKDIAKILPSTEEEEGDNEPVASNDNIAHADISDMEYLKLKAKSKGSECTTQDAISSSKTPTHKRQYFTLVIKNLPAGVKKRDLKAYFKPIPLASVRVPQSFAGMAYIGFKDEKNCNKALNKNKSFWKNKQLNIYKYSKDKHTTDEPNNNQLLNSADLKVKHWHIQEESVKIAEDIAESGRIFVRNLSYTVTEDDLTKLFEKYGPLAEVTLPIDKETDKIKGFALITYVMPEHAAQSYAELDGTVFMGRMLHLLPGKPKESEGNGPSIDEGSSFKTSKAKSLKATAGRVHTWNSLFLGTSAIADAMAEKYNASKEEVLKGDGAATRLAMGEVEIVEETRAFLQENGVRLDAFNQVVEKRSKLVILVKNLPYKTSPEELRNLFAPFGDLGRVLIPPYGITGLVEYLQKQSAKAAFNGLAYTKFKGVPLYLEWAPELVFDDAKEEKKKKDEEEEGDEVKEEPDEESKKDNEDEEDEEEEREPEPDTTLYIKNLNFNSTDESIRKHFKKCGPIASVTIARKKDPKNPGQFLSMGYGFVQFFTQEAVNKALKELQNSALDEHQIELKRSNKNLGSEADSTVQRKKSNVAKQTGAKILVRNIPFQAKQSEIEELFKAFGELKFVRLPKKMVGSGLHRGFGFVEYVSKHEAKRAMKALCQSTHLYGRRLVLEWAEEADNVEDIRKRTNRYFGTDAPGGKRSMKGVADIDVDKYSNEMEQDE